MFRKQSSSSRLFPSSHCRIRQCFQLREMQPLELKNSILLTIQTVLRLVTVITRLSTFHLVACELTSLIATFSFEFRWVNEQICYLLIQKPLSDFIAHVSCYCSGQFPEYSGLQYGCYFSCKFREMVYIKTTSPFMSSVFWNQFSKCASSSNTTF